ncbi:unnamed protein product, partial [Owenia fusiformis]
MDHIFVIYLFITIVTMKDVNGYCPVTPSSDCSCYEMHWARDLTDSLNRGMRHQCLGQTPIPGATGIFASLAACDSACEADSLCKTYNYNFKTLQCDGWGHIGCTADNSLDASNYWFFPSTQRTETVTYYDPYTTCYWISDSSDTQSFADAQAKCKALGGQLAEIDLPDEQIFLKHNPPPNNVGYVWIGLSNDASVH